MAAVLTFTERPSDSPLVERVWQSRSAEGGPMRSIAACHWELVVVRHEGKTTLRVRGPETRPTVVDCPAEGEWFAIRFKLGTFMPMFRPIGLLDLNDVVLPDATSRSFWLNASAWEYPTFENAEVFVQRLARAGLVVRDPLVADVLGDQRPRVTTRTQQRRFLHVTGLTRGAIHQIERARLATNLLRQGDAISSVAYDAGYFDQAHLTRSLRRWVGLTPAQVARTGEQLSFLYKTESP